MRFSSALAFGVLCAALGCTGPVGPEGPEGPQGDPGPEGQTGSQGSSGETGSSGQDGDPGKNAYLTGPGLQLEVDDVVLADKKATVTFRLADGSGTPLDREGKYSEGAVTVRMALGWLAPPANGNPGAYTPYTTKDQTSPLTNETATQGAADEGGSYEEVDFDNGVYSYTFATPIQVVGMDFTHTLVVWAYRDFEEQRYTAEQIFHFVPDGGPVVDTRDIVRTDACNTCHGGLRAHEGARRDVAGCVVCHTQDILDPDTGNTVDFPVMVHKIHRGKNLPSVLAGAPYQIIGFAQSVHDYSTVGFPQEIQRCATCHSGEHADVWKNEPSRRGCGSCHDGIAFEDPPPDGKTLHAGGPQPNDTKCNVCHPPAGGLQGIEPQHLTATFDPLSPVLDVQIVSAEKTAPGEVPEVVIHVTQDGADLDILASPLTRLVFTVAGPTTDYASFWQYTAQGTGATGTLTAEGANFRYKLPAPMPAAATGSYAIGIEAYIQPGGAAGPRFATKNPIAYVAVTDAVPEPRRAVADSGRCDSCHFKMSAHGGQRNNVDYCAFCHNPNQPGDERISRFESSTVEATSLDIKHFIHRIHTGEELAQQPYILGGFPAPTKANPAGTPIDFGEVRFPGHREACWTCHKDDSYLLPLSDDLLPSKLQTLTCVEDPAADADSYCDQRIVAKETFLPPATSACTGCHDAKAVVAHAETNTASNGVEACATCHGPGSDYDVAVTHKPF